MFKLVYSPEGFVSLTSLGLSALAKKKGIEGKILNNDDWTDAFVVNGKRWSPDLEPDDPDLIEVIELYGNSAVKTYVVIAVANKGAHVESNGMEEWVEGDIISTVSYG